MGHLTSCLQFHHLQSQLDNALPEHRGGGQQVISVKVVLVFLEGMICPETKAPLLWKMLSGFLHLSPVCDDFECGLAGR